MTAVPEILAGVCLLLGGAFALVAGVGLVRLPEVFTRMHASTKAGTLGVGLIAVALALTTPDAAVASKAIGCAVFLLATGPIGAHLIGRAAAGRSPVVRRGRRADEAQDRASSPRGRGGHIGAQSRSAS
jgi:multicomponent Na+:H+ antiporter subunit G